MLGAAEELPEDILQADTQSPIPQFRFIEHTPTFSAVQMLMLDSRELYLCLMRGRCSALEIVP